ncbi:alpha/beta fold hydrolase [Streptacidiphilus sp. PAMC 29251]
MTAPSRDNLSAPVFPLAKTIARGDDSTSTVLTADGPQIQIGGTPLEQHQDVVFATPSTDGQKIELKLDLLAPDYGGRKPLVVYIPGGGFIMCDKEGARNQKAYLAEHGYVVASIQYRTILHGATYRDGLADVKAAIRYLRAHADEYGIDPARVAVWGESAGGYLAAMTGATNGAPEFETGDDLDRSSAVQAVVDNFGAADLSRIGEDFDTEARLAHRLPGNAFAAYVYGPGTERSIGEHTDEVAAADPAVRAGSDSPAFLLFHGTEDRLVSPSQTQRLHQALRAKGVPSTRYVLTGADHGDLAFMGGSPEAALPWTTEEVMGELLAFLDRQLAG